MPQRTDRAALLQATTDCQDLVVLLNREDEPRCLLAAGSPSSLLGWPAASLEGERFLDRVHIEDAPAVRRALLRAGQGERATAVCRLEGADGRQCWCELRIVPRGAGHGLPGDLCLVRDVTEQREAEANLLHEAQRDPLTGTVNRVVFLDRLRHALARLERSQLKVGVLFVDLDHFKSINDAMGHAVGDQLLVATAHRLEAFLRPADTLARLGGDEFAILVEDVESAAAMSALAERITAAGRIPLQLGREEIACSVSVGAVVAADATLDPDELLDLADRAMYRTKQSGRGGHTLFDEHVRGHALKRLSTETLLRRALELDDGALVLEYQPIVDLGDQAVVAAEALMRVRSSDRGLLPAHEFMEVAAETGLVRQIDSWVLRNAALQAQVWQARGGGSVSLNVTARDLHDPAFADEVVDLVDAHMLEAGGLALEVTERDASRLPPGALASLDTLRGHGVRLLLDRFGEAGGLLMLLERLPLDAVKLLREVVAALEGSARSRHLAAGIIEACHELGVEVVAVGVETERQLEILRDLGCDMGQGHLWPTGAGPGAARVPEPPARGSALPGEDLLMS